METRRPPLFRKRQFDPAIIVTGVRWYLRFSLSLRDIEELMAECGLSVDHTTVWRWVFAGGPPRDLKSTPLQFSHAHLSDCCLPLQKNKQFIITLSIYHFPST